MNALFLGSKGLGLSVLRCVHQGNPDIKWKIIHPNDAGDSRGVLDLFHDYARRNGLDIFVASSPAATREMVRDLAPDIALVSGWYWLFDERTLSRVPMGFYGVHTSLLPKYRGGAPLVWSIINGDAEVGATVFRVASGIDDGGVLFQVRVPNLPHDNVGTLLEKIENALVETLPGKWRSLMDGSAGLYEQDNSLASYCGVRIPEDGRIDWRGTAQEVHNFIRAQTPPYPGAFDFVHNRKVVFLRTAVDSRPYYGTPGQVLQRSKDDVLISCGDNSAIKVLEAAVDGVPISPSNALPSIATRLG
jgi:methionyl-tRNA formyltransferase